MQREMLEKRRWSCAQTKVDEVASTAARAMTALLALAAPSSPSLLSLSELSRTSGAHLSDDDGITFITHVAFSHVIKGDHQVRRVAFPELPLYASRTPPACPLCPRSRFPLFFISLSSPLSHPPYPDLNSQPWQSSRAHRTTTLSSPTTSCAIARGSLQSFSRMRWVAPQANPY